jgi:hypothetical protein
LVIGLLAGSPVYADGYYICSVAQVSGKAEILRGGATLPALQGTGIMVRDRVITPPGASLTLGFDDGSSIALSSDTTLEIESNTATSGQSQSSHVTLISGDIHTIIIDKMTGQQHSIEVNTAGARATGPSPNR